MRIQHTPSPRVWNWWLSPGLQVYLQQVHGPPAHPGTHPKPEELSAILEIEERREYQLIIEEKESELVLGLQARLWQKKQV